MKDLPILSTFQELAPEPTRPTPVFDACHVGVALRAVLFVELVLALANVRDRLQLLHDVQCQFSSNLKDGLFLVRIEVPA